MTVEQTKASQATAHQEPIATVDQARAFGLSSEEWARILARLGRTPTLTETGIFSALWSEHCSYKSSRVHLRNFPSKGPRVLQGPGENAGAVDLGDGLCAVFKIESHNHPSFIEPVQGAATGVGGILRDIFTMGARPIALMDSLRFGRADHPKTPSLLRGVVKGIGGYGNAIGVPTVAGEVYFDPSYDGNILVNAFALGVCRPNEVVRAVAKGVGNLIVYLGAKTGRDGIHGATMASASFEGSGVSEEKRPTVQVGDPFKEKLLLEACMEMFEAKCLVGIQDMGAAGLSSSSSEMASRGGVGLDLDTSKVPAREHGMTPYEFMLSESQERMLICCTSAQLATIVGIATKWDVDCAVIGTVTDTGRLRVRHGEQSPWSADVSVKELTDEAPVYERRISEPVLPAPLDLATLPDLSDAKETKAELLRLLASPNMASKRWIYRQYDQDVGLATMRRPGSADAAVLRLSPLYPGRKDGVAVTVDCNARWVKAQPFEGAKAVVFEAYRNLAAAGARALALSDCLNFGSPEDPQVMGQFAAACQGISAAARVLETPVVSGNVSLYNQTGAQAIDPTPTVAMVGHVADVERAGRLAPTLAGLDVWLFGVGAPALGQSEYLWARFARKDGGLQTIDMSAEKAAADAVCGAWERGLLDAAHDLAEGGLLTALAEVVLAGASGLQIDAALPAGRKDGYLFGEGGTRFILCCPKAQGAALTQALHTVAPMATLQKLGQTTATQALRWPGVIEADRTELEKDYAQTIERIADGEWNKA